MIRDIFTNFHFNSPETWTEINGEKNRDIEYRDRCKKDEFIFTQIVLRQFVQILVSTIYIEGKLNLRDNKICTVACGRCQKHLGKQNFGALSSFLLHHGKTLRKHLVCTFSTPKLFHKSSLYPVRNLDRERKEENWKIFYL